MHTPGPWRLDNRAGGRVVAGIDDTVANTRCQSDLQHQHEANARLIAAAPEILAALEQLIDDMQDGHCVCEQAKQEAIAAVAKATAKVGPH